MSGRDDRDRDFALICGQCPEWKRTVVGWIRRDNGDVIEYELRLRNPDRRAISMADVDAREPNPSGGRQDWNALTDPATRSGAMQVTRYFPAPCGHGAEVNIAKLMRRIREAVANGEREIRIG
jgi:hypothetical protein